MAESFDDAILQKNPEKALQLLHATPDPIPENLLAKALIGSSMRGYTKMMELLLEKGAAVDTLHGGGSALMAAAACGQPKAAALLLSRGADPNVRGAEGMTPLMWAAQSGIEDREAIRTNLQLLLKAGANPRLKQNDGRTALDIAVMRKNLDAVEILKDGTDDSS